MTQPGNSPTYSRGHALKHLVNHLIASLPSAPQGAGDDQLGLVYLGNVHDSIPRLLILDQGLRLEERCVWQIMRICIIDPGRPASLLTQQQLAAQCGVDIKTMRRYLHALRANRWITHCARIHGRGTVWALHDEPLSLADTAVLDPGYTPFIHECSASNIKRLRELGCAVFRTLCTDTAHGHDYSQPVTQLEQMARRFSALETATAPTRATGNDCHQALPISGKLFFATDSLVGTNREIFPVHNGKVIHNRAICPTKNEEVIHNGENFPVASENISTAEENSSHAENFSNAHARSSNYLNNKNINTKTTTTTKTNYQNPVREGINSTAAPITNQATHQAHQQRQPRPRFKPLDTYPDWVEHLRWPQQIKPAERQMMLPALCAHDQANAQYLLNYLIDRLKAGKCGDAPAVPNPVGYLCQIAALHAKGELVESSWGTRRQHQVQTEPVSESKQMEKELAMDRMSQLKQQMGWRR